MPENDKDLKPEEERKEDLTEKAEKEEEQDESTAAMLYDWVDALVYALIAIVLIFTLVIRMTGVVGTSMVPTLQDGDKLIISNLTSAPKPGDIVVVTKKSFRDEPIVKRVIATAGQTVLMDYDEGKVYVDGVEEHFVNTATTRRGDLEFPLYVPEGFIFVLGDNRNGSTDSRFSEVGLIDERMVLGKALFRVFPLNSIGTID